MFGVSAELLLLKQLERFKKVGDRFQYLGVDMIVTSHRITRNRLGIKADYIDANGVLRIAMFPLSELPALIRENSE